MSPWPLKSARSAQRAVWGLDARQLAWRPGADRAAAPELASHAQALPQALTQLPAGATVDVVAGNDVAMHWLQVPPSTAASLDELRLVAAARCAHLYGGAPEDWWIAGDWSATEPFVCAALPRSLVVPLQQSLTAASIQARWHTAWSVACGAKANTFPSEGWSALRSPHRVMLWHCRQGRVNCLTTQRVSADATDGDAAAQALQQAQIEALRDAALANGPIHWTTLPAANDAAITEAGAALAVGELAEGAAR